MVAVAAGFNVNPMRPLLIAAMKAKEAAGGAKEACGAARSVRFGRTARRERAESALWSEAKMRCRNFASAAVSLELKNLNFSISSRRVNQSEDSLW